MTQKQGKLFTRDYIFLLLCTFFAAMTHQLFLSVFPIYVVELGGNHALTGAMITGQVIAGTVTRIICGPLQDKFGRKKLLILGAVLFVLNTAAYIFARDLPAVFLLRVLNGVSQGIFFGSAGTIVADIVSEDRLVDGIGYFGITGTLAAAFSPSIGLFLLQSYGSEKMFLFASITAVISMIFPLLINKKYGVADKAPKLEAQPKSHINLKAFIEPAVFAPALVSFFIVFVNSAATNFLAACGVERGLENVALFFTFSSGAMIVVRLITGKLTKKMGLPIMILVGCLAVVASNALIAVAYSLLPIILAGILTGLGMGIVSPLLNSVVFSTVDVKRRGVANSNYLLVNDIAQGLGGSAWGISAQHAGYTATYFLSAVMALVGTGLHGLLLAPKIKKKDE